WLRGTTVRRSLPWGVPEDLTETPAAVVSILVRQLSIDQPSCFADYCSSRQRWDHTVEIRERSGYRDFSDGPAQFRLNRWLYALCWTGTDRPGMLFRPGDYLAHDA